MAIKQTCYISWYGMSVQPGQTPVDATALKIIPFYCRARPCVALRQDQSMVTNYRVFSGIMQVLHKLRPNPWLTLITSGVELRSLSTKWWSCISCVAWNEVGTHINFIPSSLTLSANKVDEQITQLLSEIHVIDFSTVASYFFGNINKMLENNFFSMTNQNLSSNNHTILCDI